MQQIPIIELRVRDLGAELHGMIAMHHHEIEMYLKAGVEKALASIGEQIIEEAAAIATQEVHATVKNYLTYGAGGQAIRAAIEHALEPLTAMLLGTVPPRREE